LLVLSTVVLGCPAPAERGHGEPPVGHVLLIGLDGATWDLMHPLILRGELPNIERIRREGAWGNLESDEPMASPRLWATIATGRIPEDHGITGFYKKTPDGAEVTQTNLDRRARAIWNILSERQRRSTVVGWFYTWPADEIVGEFVSDRSEGAMAGGHHPPELEPMLASIADAVSPRSVRADAERFLGPSLDPNRTPLQVRREARSLEETLEEYLRVDRLRLEWTVALMRERPSELTAVFFKGIDALSHLLWIHMDPGAFESGLHPPAAVGQRFEATLPRYYELLDEAIGALLQSAPPRTDVVIVSDHGFGPEPDPTVKLAYDVNPVLSRLGWIVTDADGRPDPERSLVVDSTPHWRKTHRDRSLWINTRALAARGNGNVRSGVEDVVRWLGEVRTSRGNPLFDEVAVDSGSTCDREESIGDRRAIGIQTVVLSPSG
jgi:predicted AlkP superfamily phosphohydrolase/phosphomutase